MNHVDPLSFTLIPEKSLPPNALASIAYTKAHSESVFTLLTRADSNIPAIEILPPPFPEGETSIRSCIDLVTPIITNIFSFCAPKHEKYSFTFTVQLLSPATSVLSLLSLCTASLAVLLTITRIEAADTPTPIYSADPSINCSNCNCSNCNCSNKCRSELWMCKGVFSGRILALYAPVPLPARVLLPCLDTDPRESFSVIKQALGLLLNKL